MLPLVSPTGADHREVARTLTSLGTAHVELGDASQGRELLERSLTIKERAFGADHVAEAPWSVAEWAAALRFESHLTIREPLY